LTDDNGKISSDEELMGKVAQGDVQAFENLVYRHQRRILNLIFRFIGDRAQAEDVAQDVFLRVWQASKNYEPKSKFTTWIYRITTNLCLDLLKSAHHRQIFVHPHVHAERPDEGDELFSCSNKTRSPEDLLLAAERSRQISTALQNLPSNQRLAIILKKFDGLSYHEIAQVLGCSVSAVESLLVRAKRSLREKLLSVDSIQVSDSPYISDPSLNPGTSQSF
jgi:RNA polymerase sigma-70 factor (ECF subfamily)